MFAIWRRLPTDRIGMNGRRVGGDLGLATFGSNVARSTVIITDRGLSAFEKFPEQISLIELVDILQ